MEPWTFSGGRPDNPYMEEEGQNWNPRRGTSLNESKALKQQNLVSEDPPWLLLCEQLSPSKKQQEIIRPRKRDSGRLGR